MSGSKLSNPSVPAASADSPALDQPLGLTVHSMPEPGEVVPAEARRTRLGRRWMLLVLALCAAPVIASYTMYYLVRPSGRTNYGELIDPHTAVGLAAAQRIGPADPSTPLVTLSTAHPAKFPETVKAATGVEPPAPPQARALQGLAERVQRLPADADQVKAVVREVMAS